MSNDDSLQLRTHFLHTMPLSEALSLAARSLCLHMGINFLPDMCIEGLWTSLYTLARNYKLSATW